MKKQIVVFAFLLVMSLNAFALIPLLLAGAKIIETGLSTPAGQVYAAGAVMALGTLVQSMYVTRQDVNGRTRTDTIQYTNAPRQPRDGPETQQGFTQGYPYLTPPASGPPPGYVWKSSSSVNWHGDPDSACAEWASTSNATWTSSVTGTYPNFGCNAYNSLSQLMGSTGLQQQVSCVPGYSTSGYSPNIVCVLSDASKVIAPADGFCPIMRSGNTYSASPNDADCVGLAATPQFAADGTATISSADGRSITVTGLNAAGRATVVNYQPNAAAGTTTKTTATMAQSVPGDDSKPYVIIGASQETDVGIGTDATTTPVTTSAGSPDVVAAITAQMAADAAREQARTDKETADRVLPVLNESIPKDYIPVSISAISFTSAAACPADISFSMMGKTYAISYGPMCNLMSMLRPLFLALGAFGAAFIFIGGLKV